MLPEFFQLIGTEDARVDFYTIHKRETTGYSTGYVKKYNEDLIVAHPLLPTTSPTLGLFSVVDSAFVIDVHSSS